MKTKKTLCLLLCLSLFMGMLAGCGEKVPPVTGNDPTVENSAPTKETAPVETTSQPEPERASEVSAATYRAMLMEMLEELAPEKMDYFESKVKDAEVLITRGDAVRMAYYAAVCIGADDYNGYNFSSDLADSDGRFWETGDHLEEICPDVFKDDPVSMAGQTWDNEYTAAGLWNIWHVDLVSGKQVFAFDEDAQSMRMYDMLTMKEAQTSIERLRTGYGIKNYVPVNSSEAVTAVLSDEVLAKTQIRQKETVDDLPRLTGFVLQNDGYFTVNPIIKTPEDICRIADWGFNAARIRLTYETLFNEDGTQIDLTQVQKLDKLIAAAIEEDMHLDILFSTLPGRTKTVNMTMTDITSESEADLFVNPERQKEAIRVWTVLAERYQDVAGAHLSFTPFWEPDGDLGVGGENTRHTAQDICDTLVMLIDAIREKDPERFIFYEPTAANDVKSIIEESSLFYELLKSDYDNLMISYNFCQNAYAFAEITNIESEDVDLHNHSMFKPEYPVTIYGVNDTIPAGETLTVDGFLPVGTVIDLYLAETTGDCTLTVTGDETELYREELSAAAYDVGRKLSSFYPYATSNKKVTVTLAEAVNEVTISARGADIQWSGMDVILPEEYGVERWYMNGGYDNHEEDLPPFELLTTSAVMVCPSSHHDTWRITICDNVTYTTENISAQANAQTIEEWCEAISQFSPQCIIRYEDACFSLGTTQGSILRYYEDVLQAFQKYGFSWFSNDYELILETSSTKIADADLVEYDGYPRVNLELLELLQKYQEKKP